MVELNKKLIGIVAIVSIILLVPFIAMQFSHDVIWTTADFIIAGILLTATGLVLEFIIRKIRNKESRMIWYIFVTALLILTWMELAVGIFGTPFAGS